MIKGKREEDREEEADKWTERTMDKLSEKNERQTEKRKRGSVCVREREREKERERE